MTDTTYLAYTPIKPAAAEQMRQEARAALAEPATVAAALAVTLLADTPRQARYSLANQVMLYLQGETLGLNLRDLDTADNWARRGRYPWKTAEPVYVTFGTDAPIMVALWDISQTGGTLPYAVSGVCVVCDAVPGQPCHRYCLCDREPCIGSGPTSKTEALSGALHLDARLAGYSIAITTSAQRLNGRSVVADPGRRVIHASERLSTHPGALVALAVLVAELLTCERCAI
jgi:hypothetical protein